MSVISYGEDQPVASNDDRRGGRETGASWSAWSDDGGSVSANEDVSLDGQSFTMAG